MLSKSKTILFVALLGVLLPVGVVAQTSTTAVIVVTVTDPQGAAVGGAAIEISLAATNRTITQTTNTSGQFVFAGLDPGTYNITVKKTGFRTSAVNGFKVDVSKSYNLDIKLELGELTQTVMVEAGTGAQLQTTESTVGNVIPLGETPRMPMLTRQVNELLLLQPGAAPTGEVTGSRADQSTFTLDGIDVTNNSVGGTGTYMFLPVDAIEEFRVGVANPNATFGRGAGGQVSLLGRAGSKQYHGAGYWYHQNDNLNANSWDNDRLKIKKAELKDNRFGARAGGPLPFLWSDRVFWFANYEGRRFPNSASILRIVPSDSLKQGILKFPDSTGTVQSYDLKTTTACGGNPCDPRGLGISPTMKALWALMPAGNDSSSGDGLNTLGFRGNVAEPITNNYYEARVDENISSKWRASQSFRYFQQKSLQQPVASTQVSIIGGNMTTARSLPVMQNMAVASLSGSITNNLTADFRFGWVRERDATSPTRPNAVATLEAIAGTNTPAGFVALDAGNGNINDLLDEPFDVGTQVARKQSNDNRNFQWNADLIWTKGAHTFQFGTQVHYLPTLHLRDDKVIGALGALVARLDSGSNFSIPTADRPAAIQSADATRWDRLYTATLGLLDSISVMAVRDGKFAPLPFGSQLESDTKFWSPSFYFQDIWHIKPSLTITLGLNYEWQQAPTERLGRQTIQIDAGTGKPITAAAFFAARKAAAAAGTFFNPTFGYLPINSAGGRGVFDVDWKNLGPRLGLAWSPGSSGFLSHIFGVRKTVVRAGFGIIFDRQNTVQSVIIPALGVGFAQTLSVNAPLCSLNGTASGCTAGSSNPALSSFRVGVDGTLPVPTFPSQANPVVPFWGLSGGNVVKFPEVFSFQVDPSIKVGRNYAVDFTIQRELPGNIIAEVGYIGRMGRDLPQSMSLGQSPYTFVDPASKQTFAQAFDAVAKALRVGPTAPTQPWFNNLVPPGTAVDGTAAIVALSGSNFGTGNVSTIFSDIDTLRIKAGLPAFNNYVAQGIFLRSSTGTSNYHALFVTVNKRPSHGILFSLNYTLARSMDEVGAIQNSAGLVPNSFDLFTEYGPSAFDYRHNFNGTFVYNLPFKTSIRGLNKVISGWYISGIFTALSGAPLIMTQSAQVWGGTLSLGNNVGMVPTVRTGAFGGGLHTGVAGSALTGIGTNGNTGLNLFGDPAAVFNAMRQVNMATDGRSGRSNPIRGLGHWNLDNSIGKATKITERTQVVFAADFFNIFNHPIFADPSLSLTSKGAFGVIGSTFVPNNRSASSRWIQLSMRLEF
jgi:hypothetical protein